MASKRKAIILHKLVRESAINLESMVAELTGDALDKNVATKPAHWSKRFAASGKGQCGASPKIRL